MYKLISTIIAILLLSSCASIFPVNDDQYGCYVIFSAFHDNVNRQKMLGGVNYLVSIDTSEIESSLDSIIGDPVILNHQWDDAQLCIGRVVGCHLGFDEETGTQSIYVVARITDQEAIEKFRNGTYLKVSVAFTIVQYNIIKLDEHNGIMMLTKIDFNEISIVNVPSDGDARAVGMYWGWGSDAIDASHYRYPAKSYLSEDEQ